MWFTTTPYLYPRRRGSNVSVEYDRRGPIAVVTIDRPTRRNAIDDATVKELSDAWDHFDGDDDALVGVLTGSEGTFSAGADLEAMDLEDRPGGARLHPQARLEADGRGRRGSLRRRRPGDGTVVSATYRRSGGLVGGLSFCRHVLVGRHFSSVHGHHPRLQGVPTERPSSGGLLAPAGVSVQVSEQYSSPSQTLRVCCPSDVV